jgi:uncharacterized glyoxalase superfamily protein PhnB
MLRPWSTIAWPWAVRPWHTSPDHFHAYPGEEIVTVPGAHDVGPGDRARRRRQRVVPHLSYEDPFAALAWLCRAFGFTEAKRFERGQDNLTARLRGPDGGAVMISGRNHDFSTWMRERAPHFEEATGRSWPLLTHAITVIVDDVDAHFERAKHQGAAVLTAPKDQPWGVRSYAVLDPEGHQWEFATVTNSASGDAGEDDPG